jgi:hypothetical protein
MPRSARAYVDCVSAPNVDPSSASNTAPCAVPKSGVIYSAYLDLGGISLGRRSGVKGHADSQPEDARRIDAILEALCELDGGPRNPPGGKPQRRFSTARAQAA